MSIEFISASTSHEASGATLEFDRPSGADTGDVLIAVVASGGASSTFSPPSGWDTRYDDIWFGTRYYWCIWRAVENIGTEPSTYTAAKRNNHAFSVVTLCFRGVNPSNPFAVTTDGAIAAGLVSSFSIPSVTTSVGGAMLVSTAMRSSGDNVAPGSMTLAATAETASPFIYSAYELIPTAGSTGTRTWSRSGAGSSQGGGYMTALRPDGEIPVPSARPWSRAYIVE